MTISFSAEAQHRHSRISELFFNALILTYRQLYKRKSDAITKLGDQRIASVSSHSYKLNLFCPVILAMIVVPAGYGVFS